MHVTAQAQQVITLLHQKTLVSPLKQVTARSMPSIEIHRQRNEQPMHATAQIWPMRLRNQMKMVAHQNQAQNRRLKSSRRLGEQVHESSAILLVMKNCLAGVASCAEMIDSIFKLHSQRPRNSSCTAGAIANVKCLDLTPSLFLFPSFLSSSSLRTGCCFHVT